MSTDQQSNSSTQKGKSLSSIDTTRSKQIQELGIHQLLQNAFQDMDDENEDMKTLLPISILLEEMKSDHSSTRTYCLQNLSTIALVLGPAKAKGLLGGFISNLLKDQEKAVEDVPEELQVMLTLLESMPKLINLIGGPENSLVLLKPLLETIGDRTKDETKTMYIKIMRDIGNRLLKQQDLFEECVTQRIIEAKDGDIDEQCAAITLISNLYNIISQQVLQEWMEYFNNLMQSDEQNVRKRVVLSIKEFAQWASNPEEHAFCIELANNIFTNCKDFKSNLFFSVPALIKFHGYQEYLNKLFNMDNINAYNCFLEIFNESLLVLQNTVDSKIFIENFIKLFSKTELELKQKLSIYCGKLVVFIKQSKTIYKGYLVQIQQYMTQLEQEKNFMIKQNLVDSVILILNQATDRRIYYQQEEIQYFLRFLMNQLISGDTDLKFKFVSKQKSFNIILQFISDNAFSQNESLQIIKNLLQVIIDIEQCKNWRMRQQCLISMQMFLTNLQQFQLFKTFQSDELEIQLIKRLLQDRISVVREESSKTLLQLFRSLKENDMIEKGKIVIDQLIELLKHPNYLVRVNFVLGVRNAFFLGEYTYNILRQLKNEVPNVKLALLEVLYNNKKCKQLDLIPINDLDQDVRDVAQIIYQQFK
ncbi:unnamed protein product [Paramecium pentaurelia]|uniref:DED domain-containing protein n=1 Tax=Paramecium pentaurelia TaxID=43138 RepID=A0A8S1TDR8_9CILI|nr:unnamed protein product [Paramecium pentaurelia]